MCIQAPIICPHCSEDLAGYHHRRRRRSIMSFQKKNVILGFRKDEYVPTAEQQLVKYSSGKGNNLHEVECMDGSILLVSMPKKYRHTVWLKKEDCLVIDPIEEGKKVRGEIVCVLPLDTVRDLIVSRRWPNPSTGTEIEDLLKFFTSSERKPNREEFDAFPPSDSSDMESDEPEEDGEDEGDEDDDAEDEGEEAGDNEDDPEENDSEAQSKVTEGGDNDTENSQSQSPSISNDVDDSTLDRERNRSRVQLVTSGIVTVTNVLTEGMENDMQSLEFGADEEEESSDELGSEARDVQRHANTIRIQVNYNNQEN